MVAIEPAAWPVWRQHYLARLHAERARLLWGLVGLPTASLSDEPVEEGWTAKDILAHIGLWDGAVAHALARLTEGRAVTDLPDSLEALDQRNAEWLARHRTLSLDAALALCLKERNAYLNALAQLPDAILHTHPITALGRETTPLLWVRLRYRHDRMHAEAIAAWRLRAGLTRPTAGPIPLLLAAMRAARRELRALIDLLPPAERAARPVWGEQPLTHLLAHLIGWDVYARQGVTQRAAPPWEAGLTFAAFNARSVATYGQLTWDALWQTFQTSHQQLLEVTGQLHEADGNQPFPSPAGDIPTLYHWLLIWPHHELEHAAELRAALALPRTPDYLLRAP